MIHLFFWWLSNRNLKQREHLKIWTPLWTSDQYLEFGFSIANYRPLNFEQCCELIICSVKLSIFFHKSLPTSPIPRSSAKIITTFGSFSLFLAAWTSWRDPKITADSRISKTFTWIDHHGLGNGFKKGLELPCGRESSAENSPK